jgi:hypothetical protein
MAEVGRGIDPTRDVAGILDGECFLCGKGRATGLPCDSEFGPKSKIAPQLPHHAACLHGRRTVDVIDEYHRRISDLAGARRTN